MESAVATPPVTLEARMHNLSEATFTFSPIVFLVKEEINNELAVALKRLEDRIKSLVFKAKTDGNERRVSELRYFERNVGLLKNISKSEYSSESMVEVSKGYKNLYNRAQIELRQFMIEGKKERVVEMYDILDDLNALKKKAAEYGIEI